MKKKRNDLRLIKEKHDQRLIKERGPNVGRRKGKLSMERIKWKKLGSKDQDLKKDQT